MKVKVERENRLNEVGVGGEVKNSGIKENWNVTEPN